MICGSASNLRREKQAGLLVKIGPSVMLPTIALSGQTIRWTVSTIARALIP